MLMYSDNVKLCAEHARVLHKAIPCHKAYQVPPYVSLMVGAGGTEERGYSGGTEAP